MPQVMYLTQAKEPIVLSHLLVGIESHDSFAFINQNQCRPLRFEAVVGAGVALVDVRALPVIRLFREMRL